jgi:hypothetical protein
VDESLWSTNNDEDVSRTRTSLRNNSPHGFMRRERIKVSRSTRRILNIIE